MYLIDHSNFSYKFKSVYKNSKMNINGVLVDTSVLMGYLYALKNNVFNDIIICLDGIPEHSNNIMKGYKGTRNHELDDTQISVPRLEVVQFLSKVGPYIGKNITIACAPFQEADQVISSITHMATNNLPPRYKFISMLAERPIEDDYLLRFLKDYQASPLEVNNESVVVASTDADLKILQTLPNVYTDESTSGKGVGTTTAQSVKNVNPFAILPYKCIFGDVSDAIDGYKFPESVARLLDSLIKDKPTMDRFIEDTIHSIQTPGFYEIQSQIWAHDGGKLFKRNYDLTHMQFWSIPKKITFPNYDINSTIQKYGINPNYLRAS